MGPIVSLTRVGPDTRVCGPDGSLAEFVMTLDDGSPCFSCGHTLAKAPLDGTGSLARCPVCGAEVAIAAGGALQWAA